MSDEASAGDVALYLLSRITKLYRSFDGEDNELIRSAIEAAERLLADHAAAPTENAPMACLCGPPFDPDCVMCDGSGLYPSDDDPDEEDE